MLNNKISKSCFSQKISTEAKEVYSTHMCSLCHSLGDEYGLAARTITNHEGILLNLLIAAQVKNESSIIDRPCPINPLKTVHIKKDLASHFAANISVELARANFDDHVRDSGGKDIAASLAYHLLGSPHKASQKFFEKLGLWK